MHLSRQNHAQEPTARCSANSLFQTLHLTVTFCAPYPTPTVYVAFSPTFCNGVEKVLFSFATRSPRSHLKQPRQHCNAVYTIESTPSERFVYFYCSTSNNFTALYIQTVGASWELRPRNDTRISTMNCSRRLDLPTDGNSFEVRSPLNTGNAMSFSPCRISAQRTWH